MDADILWKDICHWWIDLRGVPTMPRFPLRNPKSKRLREFRSIFATGPYHLGLRQWLIAQREAISGVKPYSLSVRSWQNAQRSTFSLRPPTTLKKVAWPKFLWSLRSRWSHAAASIIGEMADHPTTGINLIAEALHCISLPWKKFIFFKWAAVKWLDEFWLGHAYWWKYYDYLLLFKPNSNGLVILLHPVNVGTRFLNSLFDFPLCGG